MARGLGKLKGVDFYRKIPTDLTEGSLSGAALSIAAAIVMIVLFGAELNHFLTLETQTSMVVDRSAHGELLRINFNISFPSLSCEFATLDVSDALGTKRLNLTRTVRKLPINDQLERMGHYIHDDRQLDIKYDELPDNYTADTINYSAPLSKADFEAAMAKYDIIIGNFYAPWCPWCQRLEPTWEAVREEVHTKYPDTDGRIHMAKIDCTAEVDLCREHHITGFPSLRVFRKGHDEIMDHGRLQEHESYKGDRTKDSLLSFVDSLAPSAGRPHYYVRGMQRVAKSNGCALSGFVLVKKVPGTLHFLPKSPGHSFDYHSINMSHTVGYMYYGNKPSPRRRKALEQYHPMGLTEDWADKMANQAFNSKNQRTTFEHYMQVVLTSVQPSAKNSEASFDAYEYTVHSHLYNTDDVPTAKFSYDMSPIQIIVTEKRKALYHFVTTTCAIIGGVFTVTGILDGILYGAGRLAKKVDLGKQG